MNVITLYCGKGGTGKTTTATNLSAALARHGKKVLLIDGDWQASATYSLGGKPNIKRPSIADLLLQQIKINDSAKMKEYVEYATVFIEHENFYFIPANPLMNNKEIRYVLSNPDHCYVFRDLLMSLDYDYVIIDMAPSMDIFLDLALNASNSVIVVTGMEFLSYSGLENTMGIIATNIKTTNPKLNIIGVLLNMVGKSGLSDHIRKATIKLAKMRGVHVFNTSIPLRDNIRISPMKGQTVVNARKSVAQTAYLDLATEIMSLLEKE